MTWYPADNEMYRTAKDHPIPDPMWYLAHQYLHAVRDRQDDHLEEAHKAELQESLDNLLTNRKGMIDLVKSFLEMDGLPVTAIMVHVRELVDGYLGKDKTAFEQEHPPATYSSSTIAAQASKLIATNKAQPSSSKKDLMRAAIEAGFNRKDCVSLMGEAFDMSVSETLAVYHQCRAR